MYIVCRKRLHRTPIALELQLQEGASEGARESERARKRESLEGVARAHARERTRPGKDGVPYGRDPDGLPHTYALCSPSVVLPPVYR